MKVRRNKVNGCSVEIAAKLSIERPAPGATSDHLTLYLFILISPLQEDFLNKCISSAEARAWYLLEGLDTGLLMNEPKQPCLAFSVLDSTSTPWILSRHSKLNLIKIVLIYFALAFSCPTNLFSNVTRASFLINF